MTICQKVKPSKKKYPKKKRWDFATFEKATHCHICGDVLGGDKVWDHFHFKGKYRSAAHNKCNLAFHVPKFFPVFFHNLSGYDSHIFIKNLGMMVISNASPKMMRNIYPFPRRLSWIHT